MSNSKVAASSRVVTLMTPTFDLPCFDKYRLPDGRVVTSTACKKTEQWYELELLVPHEPLRRDLTEVNYLLNEHVKASEPWKLVNFFEWYNSRFLKLVHEHHDAEEEVMFPEIKKHIPDLPDKVSADHKELMVLLDAISALGVKYKKLGGNDVNTTASAKILPQLQTAWNDLVVMMMPHLAEEEQQMIGIIKDHVTEDIMAKMTQEIIKKFGISGASLAMPHIMESCYVWMTPAQQQDFFKKVPPPIRLLNRLFWEKSHAKYHRGALISLRSGHPKVIIRKTSWFF